MSFYKYENEQLLISDDMLTFPEGLMLFAAEHAQYTYPIYDWYWFDDKKQALTFFNVPKDNWKFYLPKEELDV